MKLQATNRLEIDFDENIDEDGELCIYIEQREYSPDIYINKNDAIKIINHLQRVFDIKGLVWKL